MPISGNQEPRARERVDKGRGIARDGHAGWNRSGVTGADVHDETVKVPQRIGEHRCAPLRVASTEREQDPARVLRSPGMTYLGAQQYVLEAAEARPGRRWPFVGCRRVDHHVCGLAPVAEIVEESNSAPLRL